MPILSHQKPYSMLSAFQNTPHDWLTYRTGTKPANLPSRPGLFFFTCGQNKISKIISDKRKDIEKQDLTYVFQQTLMDNQE
ncbi:hypothetical protein HanIR_Chr02g0071791 [Helianthus annuus]|nr:hypothetical protein HanIR_Chr02g0071791 [Helianthus annuus]